MYEIERLCADDYDELLAFLNRVFGYQTENGFDRFLPVMWRRDDAHMGKHFAIRDGTRIIAAIGVYPLRVHIGKTELCIATCGNVGTEEAYRGRNCMRELMGAAMAELDAIGADAARLGGQRQRYERYGFAPVGTLYTHRLNRKNAMTSPIPEITFREIRRKDTQALRFASALQEKKPFYVSRGSMEEVYDIMCAWNHRPYLALDATGEAIGVLSVSSDRTSVAEQYAVNTTAECDMLRAWATNMAPWELTCRAYPWDAAFSREIGGICENVTVTPATQCRIMHPGKLANALLAMEGEAAMPDGHFTLELSGQCCLRFENGTCTEAPVGSFSPDLTLDPLTGARFLFGCAQPDTVCGLPRDKERWIRSVFPLPFGWNGQDRV